MKQTLVLKEVVLERPTTLKSILTETLLENSIPLEQLEKVANHLIFSIDNVAVMNRDLNTEIKTGQNVKLTPAVAAG